MIVTELGLLHIIRSDNGPCYSSKEFQQFLQCYSIMHQTSSPTLPRSNGFTERMVGVSKKLMDKAGSEGKPWISGLLTTGSPPPRRQHCITSATDDTVQTKEEKPSPAAQCIGCTRNAPNTPGAHQEAEETSLKGVSGDTSRYTSLGATQAKCHMGTCCSGNVVYLW